MPIQYISELVDLPDIMNIQILFANEESRTIKIKAEEGRLSSLSGGVIQLMKEL
jgi:hypothetical protein